MNYAGKVVSLAFVGGLVVRGSEKQNLHWEIKFLILIIYNFKIAMMKEK